MKKNIYICWLDDIPSTIQSYDPIVELIEIDHEVKFIIDAHNNTNHFDTIARNIEEGLIFFIDYNLNNDSGSGLNGHDVIKLIREHNKNCHIVFYSSKSTQAELRALVKEYDFVTCVL